MVQRADISQVLSQMRTIQSQIQKPQQDIANNGMLPVDKLARPEQATGFGELFSRAVDSVNTAQQEASALKQAYEAGEPGVSLTQAMIASEKASVSFQAMTQVRNKLVEAYKDIMNMPI
jgi:flagellar hook-basal body complex protein FliE